MIFVSYASEDRKVAERLVTLLENEGYECWIDKSAISKGGDYGEIIPDAIEKCDVFLLLLSKNTQDSIWVPKELNLALRGRKKVLPFVLDAVKLNRSFDFKLENVQRIDANRRFNKAFEELKEALAEVEPKKRAEQNPEEGIVYDEGLNGREEKEDFRRSGRGKIGRLIPVKTVVLLLLFMCICASALLTRNMAQLKLQSDKNEWLESVVNATETADLGEISIKVGIPIEGEYLEIDWENEDARTSYFEYKVLNLSDQSILSMDKKQVSVGFTTYTLRFAEGTIRPSQSYRLWVGAFSENDEMIAQNQIEWNIDCFHAFEDDGICKKCGQACLHGRMKKVPLAEEYVKVTGSIHRSITKYGLECTYCGFVISANAETVESNALHQFDSNGVCCLCGMSSDD